MECEHSFIRKGLPGPPSPVVGKKYQRLRAIPIIIQDPELREDIMNFELTNEITEAHIARLLELAVSGWEYIRLHQAPIQEEHKRREDEKASLHSEATE